MAAIEHLSRIPVPAAVSNEIITNAIDASGLASLVNVQVAPNSDTVQTYDLTYARAKFHNPVNEQKTPSDLDAKLVEVKMYPIYQIYKVHDDDELGAQQVIAQMQRDLPKVLANTLQQAVFPVNGLVEGNPWVGSAGFGLYSSTVFDTTVEEDLTKASGWLDATNVKGYSGMLLSDATKDMLQGALVEGSNTNLLTFGVGDGTLVRGKPVYFSDLDDTPATTVAGIAGDWSKAVLFVDNSLQLQRVDGSTDYELMLDDAVAYRLKWRVGFGVADEKYFKVFKHKASE